MKARYYLVIILSMQSMILWGEARPKHFSKYFIAIKKNEGNLERTLNELSNYTPLLPPSKKFYADPMLFKYKGVNYLFFEDFDYKKGRIAYVTVDRNMHVSEPKVILDLPYHISFPYIFTDGGKMYMVPENASHSEVSLFEAVQFPDKWKKVSVLLNRGWYGDSILFKHEGYYWIFTCKDSVANLHIYFSKNMFSGFQPHPINSKKIQGRNAGKIFTYKGKMIRPVMNCGLNGSDYGYSMTLKEIIELTPSTFIERDFADIKPTWAPGLNGTHTFNVNEDLIVYDGRRLVSAEEV